MPSRRDWLGLLLLPVLLTAIIAACDDAIPAAPDPQPASREADAADPDAVSQQSIEAQHSRTVESVAQAGGDDQQAAQQDQRRLAQPTRPAGSAYIRIPSANARITVARTIATFDGYIDEHAVYALILGTSGLPEHVGTVVISSRDGLPSAARRLGLWLFVNQIRLVVDGACLTVCAEYVFPAATTKLIREGAIVAWQVGSLGAWHLAAQNGLTRDDYVDHTVDSFLTAEEQQSGRRLPGQERASRRQEQAQLLVEELERAEEFFATIRVSPEISSWGALAATKTASPAAGAIVWTFSIVDMARFGIANVSHENDLDYPTASVLNAASAVLIELPDAAAPALTAPRPDRADELLRPRFARGDVTVADRTARYVGYLTRPSVSQLLREVSDADPPVDTLVIASGGGETGLGREIGTWVHEGQITVVVEGYCFSSCANYIFTAAPKKVIRGGAVVGWHGSEQQGQYISINGECLDPDGSDSAAVGSSTAGVSVVRLSGLGIEEEVSFLAEVGVSVDALLYGHMPERCEHFVTAGVAGWTFSIAGMAAFGITNVSYEGDGEYPGPHQPGRVPLIVYDLSGGPPRLLGVATVDP